MGALVQLLTFVSFMLAICNLICSAALDCDNNYRSSTPQSTFSTLLQDGRWKCPSLLWKKVEFSTTRLTPTLEPLDISTLTTGYVSSGNKTTLILCSVKPSDAYFARKWPSGTYCVPSPIDVKCPDYMQRVTTQISAPGRQFNCAGNLPMTGCKDGGFTFNACCPKSMQESPDLDVPIYNIDSFHLLKTNKTCPTLYSFSPTEESITISNATSDGELGPYFGADVAGKLKLTFCRYSRVICEARAQNTDYESVIAQDPCKRKTTVYCKRPNKVQPRNTKNMYDEYCFPDGKFSSTSYCGQKCASLPTIPDASLVPDHSTPTEVRVVCADGHVSVGVTSTTCQRNGRWSADISNTTCKFVQCKEEDLPVPASTTAWVTDETPEKFNYGHNVTFTCKSSGPPLCSHFPDLLPSKIGTCQGNGTWSDVPTCKAGTDCPTPANTTSSYHTPTSARLQCSTKIDYTCKDHFVNATVGLEMTCRSDGSWDTPPPACDLAYCDSLQLDLEHGEIVKLVKNNTFSGMFVVGDIVKFECDPEYRLVGDVVISCGADGHWNGTASVHCNIIECPLAPLNITNGHRIDGLQNQTVYHLGEEVVYVCDSKVYELNYTDPVVCNNDDTWNPYIPSCLTVTCESPPIVADSVPSPSGTFPIHTTFNYSCKEGFRILGNSSVTCEFDDEDVLDWIGPPPVCEKVECGAAPVLDYGAYTQPPSDSSYPYNTFLTFSCLPGYNSSKYYSTTCSGNGDWSPAPACNPVVCRAPPIPYSVVNDTRTLYPYITPIRVECDSRKLAQPSQDLVCREDGHWFVVSGEELISCHGVPVTEPVHGPQGNKKWTFVGVGLAMFVLLVSLLLVYIIKKRREQEKDPFSHGIASVNPSYSSKGNEVTGFNNPNYEDTAPRTIGIDHTPTMEQPGFAPFILGQEEGITCPEEAHNRLSVSLNTAESERSPPQYDTLQHVRKDTKDPVEVREPAEGQYNTLSVLKSADYTNEAFEDDEDLYNVPTTHNTDSRNPYSTYPSSPPSAPSSPPSLPEEEEDDDIYNIPTLGRSQPMQMQVGDEEINDLYNNVAAAELAGTPLETDFDSIIYDRI